MHRPELTEHDGYEEPTWDNPVPAWDNAALFDFSERVANSVNCSAAMSDGWYLPEVGDLCFGSTGLWDSPSWEWDASTALAMPAIATPTPPDYDRCRECLLFKPMSRVKKTLAATTQFAKNVVRLPMRRHFASRSPALNVTRLNEPYATDTAKSSIKSREGYNNLQLYVGKNSLRTHVYGM